MITVSSADLQSWIAALLWPLTRILGLIAAAPLFGNKSVPTTVKVGLGVMLALVMAPLIPAMPKAEPMSYAGLLILMQQFIIGVSMGFAMRIVFAGIEMTGEVIGMTMGLGFASFFDPQSQTRSSAISQFLALIATMAFLAVNGHLVLISVLAESFIALPIQPTPLEGAGFKQMAEWGGVIFRTAVQLSLPIVAALLLTNIALGILTRAAPQLNIFGIGFPITIGVGFIMLMVMLPYMGRPIEKLFNEGIEKSRQVPRFMATKPAAPARPTPLAPLAPLAPPAAVPGQAAGR